MKEGKRVLVEVDNVFPFQKKEKNRSIFFAAYGHGAAGRTDTQPAQPGHV
jgi:hypothetical protein